MSVTINGTSGISATNISGIVDLINTGNTTLGNDSSDVITINGGTVNLTATNAKISNAAGDSLTPYAGFKNKIINGNFDIWERGTSQTTASYGSDDRWFNNHNGSTKTHSRQAFTLGQTAVPNNPHFFSRTVVTSVAGAGNSVTKAHRIEDVTLSSDKTMTLSFWAKADANKNIAVSFLQHFGTGGSPSAQVTGLGVTTFALTTNWQKFTTTVTFPSVSGKTLGTNNDDFYSFGFWFDAGSSNNSSTNSLGQQSGTFDIAQVQLEEGTIATPFEMRPQQVELALCQRYYQIGRWTTRNNQINAGAVLGATAYFPVQLRNTPTVVVTPVSGTVSSSSVTPYDLFLEMTVAASGQQVSATFTASAEI
jgi:hypothetical protein